MNEVLCRDVIFIYDILFSVLSFIFVFIRYFLVYLSVDWLNFGVGEYRDKRIFVLWILIFFFWFVMNVI